MNLRLKSKFLFITSLVFDKACSGIIITPLISHTYGVSALGLFTQVSTIGIIFQTLLFTSLSTSFISQHEHLHAASRKLIPALAVLVSLIVCILFLVSILLVPGFAGYVSTILFDSSDRALPILVSLVFYTAAESCVQLYIYTYVRAADRLRLAGLLLIAINIITLSLLILASFIDLDLLLVIVLISFSKILVISGSIALRHFRNNLKLHCSFVIKDSNMLTNLSRDSYRIAKGSLSVLAFTALVNFAQNYPKLMFGFNGFYDDLGKISAITVIFSTIYLTPASILGITFFPMLSRLKDNSKKYELVPIVFSIIIIISLPVALSSFLFGNLLLKIYGGSTMSFTSPYLFFIFNYMFAAASIFIIIQYILLSSNQSLKLIRSLLVLTPLYILSLAYFLDRSHLYAYSSLTLVFYVIVSLASLPIGCYVNSIRHAGPFFIMTNCILTYFCMSMPNDSPQTFFILSVVFLIAFVQVYLEAKLLVGFYFDKAK